MVTAYPKSKGKITVPYSLSVKSLKRLKLASKLVRYYESVSIALPATNKSGGRVKMDNPLPMAMWYIGDKRGYNSRPT